MAVMRSSHSWPHLHQLIVQRTEPTTSNPPRQVNSSKVLGFRSGAGEVSVLLVQDATSRKRWSGVTSPQIWSRSAGQVITAFLETDCSVICFLFWASSIQSKTSCFFVLYKRLLNIKLSSLSILPRPSFSLSSFISVFCKPMHFSTSRVAYVPSNSPN